MTGRQYYVKNGVNVLTQAESAAFMIKGANSGVKTFELPIRNNLTNRTNLDTKSDITIWLPNSLLTPIGATASSTLAGSNTANAWDNNVSTAWISDISSTEEYIEFDLGANKGTEGCRLHWYATDSTWGLTDIKIQVKSAGGSYIDVYNAPLSYIDDMNGKWTYFNWGAITARYIKISLNGGAATKKWIAEMDAIINDVHQQIFTGYINGEDGVEYLSRTEIKLSGFGTEATLARGFFMYLQSTERKDPVSIQCDDGGVFTDNTTPGTNDTINDVSIPITGVNDATYIGYSTPFNVAMIKYSTAGVYNATILYEYYNGSAWVDLPIPIDETYGFQRSPNTRFLLLGRIPTDWAETTVNGIAAYYIRSRVSVWTNVTTTPLLDRVYVGTPDVFRIKFDNIAANTILQYILTHANIQLGTSYTLAECPSTLISLNGEYSSHLVFISEVAKALLRTDGSDKYDYEWWIDSSDGVHIADMRETFTEIAPCDISRDLVLFNKKDSHTIANRVFGLGYGDGVNQIRSYKVDQAGVDTDGLSDVLATFKEIKQLDALDHRTDVELTKTKATRSKYKGEMRLRSFIDQGLEWGDWVKINQSEWNAISAIVRIAGYSLSPTIATLDIREDPSSISGLIGAMGKKIDVQTRTMQGATNIYQVGPVLDNFQRIEGSTDIIYPLTLSIYIPTQTKVINRVVLNWTLSPFRSYTAGSSSINTTVADTGHNHALGKISGVPGGSTDGKFYMLAANDIGTGIYSDGSGITSTNSSGSTHYHDMEHTHALKISEAADEAPTMELKIGSTIIGSSYTGDQVAVDVTDFMSVGENIVTLYPVNGTSKKGRAQLDGIVQCFIDSN